MTQLDGTARRAATAWAGVIGVPPAWLTEPGVHVHARTDDRPHVSFLRIAGTVLSVPDSLVADLDGLGDDAATLDGLQEHLGDRVTRIVGPARMGWLPDDWSAPPGNRSNGIISLQPTDRRLGAFHNRLPPTDQEEWAVRATHAHALVRGGRVIAAALASTSAEELAHLGVATATDHRLQGHATAVATRACEDAIERGLVPQFRSAERNRGSWRTAANVGFIEWACQAVLDLDAS